MTEIFGRFVTVKNGATCFLCDCGRYIKVGEEFYTKYIGNTYPEIYCKKCVKNLRNKQKYTF